MTVHIKRVSVDTALSSPYPYHLRERMCGNTRRPNMFYPTFDRTSKVRSQRNSMAGPDPL